MRQVGQKSLAQPARLPDAVNFQYAKAHQLTGQTLAAVSTTGIVKGIYRFTSHEEMNRHSDQALSRAIAANVRQRESSRR